MGTTIIFLSPGELGDLINETGWKLLRKDITSYGVMVLEDVVLPGVPYGTIRIYSKAEFARLKVCCSEYWLELERDMLNLELQKEPHYLVEYHLRIPYAPEVCDFCGYEW